MKPARIPTPTARSTSPAKTSASTPPSRRPRVIRDEAGLLHVTLPIRAATDLELYVDYRVTFFDSTGQTVSQFGWQTKVLHPNIFEEINVVSTTPQAADFRIDLRYAK